jgi:hypothetical protein
MRLRFLTRTRALTLTNPPAGSVRRPRATSLRPGLDQLEDRSLPSGVSFSPAVYYPTGGGAHAVAVADFDGDGRSDVATADRTGNDVAVLLGNGDGTFQPARIYATGSRPLSVQAADLNGDGRPDLVVANFLGNSVSVLLGNGDGTFQPARTLATGANPSSVVVGDFNGDGKADLATANTWGEGVSVLLGNGDGTFQPARFVPTGSLPTSLAVADFDRDGKLDLVVGYSVYDGVSVLPGNGDGTFGPGRFFFTGSGDAPVVAVADVNRDGKPDVVVGTQFGVPGTASLLLGVGDGSFQPFRLVDLGSGSAENAAAVGDFNGDGNPDLAVTGGVALGNGDGTFQPAQSLGGGGVGLAVGEFNGDGRTDLATASESGAGILLNAWATTTTLAGPATSATGQTVTFTASVVSGGNPVAGGTVTFLDYGSPIGAPVPVDASGTAVFSTAAFGPGAHSITATFNGTPGGAGTTGFGPSRSDALGLNVTLAVAAVNVAATAGAPFAGAVATFIDPTAQAGTYSATIDWGDGSTTYGTIAGTGTFTVTGSHTYADPGNDTLAVTIWSYGPTPPVTVHPTAAVTSLGLGVAHGLAGGIGFWHSGGGQALINSFNGGPNSTALSGWLAASFPNLYGSFVGLPNSQVASYFQSLFGQPGLNAEAEVLATALNVYATTLSLGGTAGQAYGFTVTAAGLGAYSFNVGADGAASGVANNTTLNVYELLRAVDQRSTWWGQLYSGDATLRRQANDLFDALNLAGSIS